ncbi:MAG: hypothetical protein R2856_28315 [Caldilineaceae bacterium]
MTTSRTAASGTTGNSERTPNLLPSSSSTILRRWRPSPASPGSPEGLIADASGKLEAGR